MSAVALVEVPCGQQPDVRPPGGHADPADDLDLTAGIARLTSLGITVRSTHSMRQQTAALFSEPDRTLTLRADLPLTVALAVLHDLHQMHTVNGHCSWSVPTTHLRVVS